MKRSTPQRQRIGPAVRRLRQQQSLTLDELAKVAGISPSHLSRLERSQTLPSFPVLAKIAEALGVDIDDFARLEQDVTIIDAQLEHYFEVLGLEPEQREELLGLSIEGRRIMAERLHALSDISLTPVDVQDQACDSLENPGGLPGLAATARAIAESGMPPAAYSRALMRLELLLGPRLVLVGNPSLLPVAPGADLLALYRDVFDHEPLDLAAEHWWQEPPDGAPRRGTTHRPVRALVGRRALESPLGPAIARSLLAAQEHPSTEVAITERELGPVNVLVVAGTYALLERLMAPVSDGAFHVALWLAGEPRVSPLGSLIDDLWRDLPPAEKAAGQVRQELQHWAGGEPHSPSPNGAVEPSRRPDLTLPA